MKNHYNHRQLFSLALLIMLVPALRLSPSMTTQLAGRASWLSPIFSLPFILAWLCFLYKLMAQRKKDEALPQLMYRLLGKRLGLAAVFIQFLWLSLYSSFVLRSGADRFIVTIYPHTSAAVFSVSMGILGLIASLMSARTLVRTAGIIRPLIIGALIVILFFSFFNVDIDNLLPVTSGELPSVVLASVLPFDIVVGSAYSVSFFTASLGGEKLKPGTLFLYAGACVLLIFLLSISIIGSFGAELCSRLSRPFFVLVRNLVFFNSIERVEAMVVMLWIFPDFLLIGLFMSAARDCILLMLSEKFSVESIRVYVCAALGFFVIIISLFIAPDSVSLEKWSSLYIPAANLFMTLVFLPAVYIIGKLRARSND